MERTKHKTTNSHLAANEESDTVGVRIIESKEQPCLTPLFSVPACQDFHSGCQGRVPNQSEQRLPPTVVTGTELTPEPLYFEVSTVSFR